MAESTTSPRTVDPTVRVHKYRPFVSNFIFANTKELTNSPAQKAISDAATMRGVWPKIKLTAACWFGDIVLAAGSSVTTNAISDAKIKAPNPARITFRDRL